MIHSIAAPLRRRGRIACTLAAFALAACVTAPPPGERNAPAAPLPATNLPAVFTRVAWDELPGFASDRLGEAWPAFLAGCRALVANTTTAATWRPSCEAGQSLDARDEAAVRAFVAGHFSPYAVSFPDGRRDGLVTGYYEPTLEGSRSRSARFPVALYAVPDDLLVVDLVALHPELANRRVRARVEGRRVVPYWSRREIEGGRAVLDGKALAYVADPLDAFLLQVQGSGRIALDDGTVLRLGYADQNGHPYRAIANALIARGEMSLEDASIPAIREWARRNPDRLPELLDENPSYVFFRALAPPQDALDRAIDGPIGALGVPLLARRTIAVDPRAIALGAPVWISTTQPSTGAPIERLVLAQDSGGAIRGAVRADYFWGRGEDAAQEAGRMRATGRLWVLWPTGAAPTSAP